MTNEGSISGGTGVYFKDGGSVANLAGLTSIYGALDGIRIKGAAGTVTNAGTVNEGGDVGVYLLFGGAVTNRSGGTIDDSGLFGIFVTGGSSGTVVNAGLVTAASEGIFFASGGAVTNQSGGTIESGGGGILILPATGIVTNAGVISGGSSYGIRLGSGGTVVAQGGGTISGPTVRSKESGGASGCEFAASQHFQMCK